MAPPETIRVFSKGPECMKDGVAYFDGEEFTKSHLRLKCVKGVIEYTAIGEDFVHRNVIHRCFGSTRFLQYAEHTKNYAVVRSLKSLPVDKKFDIKSHVESVLDDSGYAEKRARSMDIEDFLALLLAFNKADIHFS
ncbi:hypothetical protein AAVH_20017 [Aphelenchoides avenae]|nr:hypothetical protein AAVH_20017 [Aphelenchus avenae]